jgi:hypothetical protein
MSNKTIFKNTDRVRTTVPYGKLPSYKISKTVITGEPVGMAKRKLPKLNIPVPTIGEKTKPVSKKNNVARSAKEAAKVAATVGRKGAQTFKGVFALDKKFSRGGKVYK